MQALKPQRRCRVRQRLSVRPCRQIPPAALTPTPGCPPPTSSSRYPRTPVVLGCAPPARQHGGRVRLQVRQRAVSLPTAAAAFPAPATRREPPRNTHTTPRATHQSVTRRIEGSGVPIRRPLRVLRTFMRASRSMSSSVSIAPGQSASNDTPAARARHRRNTSEGMKPQATAQSIGTSMNLCRMCIPSTAAHTQSRIPNRSKAMIHWEPRRRRRGRAARWAAALVTASHGDTDHDRAPPHWYEWRLLMNGACS